MLKVIREVDSEHPGLWWNRDRLAARIGVLPRAAPCIRALRLETIRRPEPGVSDIRLTNDPTLALYPILTGLFTVERLLQIRELRAGMLRRDGIRVNPHAPLAQVSPVVGPPTAPSSPLLPGSESPLSRWRDPSAPHSRGAWAGVTVETASVAPIPGLRAWSPITAAPPTLRASNRRWPSARYRFAPAFPPTM